MNELFDDSLCYLLEAQSYIDSFIEISAVDSFFEDTDETKNAIKHNQNASNGAVGAIGKAIDALIQAAKNIITRISNFIKGLFMSKEERARFKAFEEMVKKNPNLAKKQVSIENWKEYEKQFDIALNELEKESRKENPSIEAGNRIVKELENSINKLTGNASSIPAKFMLSTTLDAAIDLSKRNVAAAKLINDAIQKEMIDLEKVRDTLGDKRVDKFEKKMNNLSKEGVTGFFHRLKIKVFYKKETTFEAIMKKQINRIMSFTNIKDFNLEDGKNIVDAKSVATGLVKNRNLIKDVTGKSSGEIVVNAAKKGVKAKFAQMKANRVAKQKKRDIDELKGLIRSKE